MFFLFCGRDLWMIVWMCIRVFIFKDYIFGHNDEESHKEQRLYKIIKIKDFFEFVQRIKNE